MLLVLLFPAVLTPNFIRFAKNSSIAVWTTVIAFFLGNTLMFCFGAVGGAYTGKDDIFYVMIAQGLAIPALIVLGANIWTTNNNALYTGGLAISNISKVRMKWTTWISGIIGTDYRHGACNLALLQFCKLAQHS